MPSQEQLSKIEITAEKAKNWLAGVRLGLQRQVDIPVTAGYLASIDLSATPSNERNIPSGVIDEGTERFLTTLEKMSWSEDTQSKLATLEDLRANYIRQNQTDICVEQFATLRTYLDSPDFYNS